MSHSIDVNLKREESYAIHAGMHVLDALPDFCASTYYNRKAFLVFDSRVYDLHGSYIEGVLQRYFKSCVTIKIPEGERSKSVDQWHRLQNIFLEKGIERSTPVFAIGGGVTGDLAGFAASSVLRGVPLVHIPTSLLAMVDSSIGGKTGINHPTGKNLIGAFYQPDAVFADLQLLNTLEKPEWVGGMAEMLKYAAMYEPKMFDVLKEAVEQGFRPSAQWADLVGKSIAAKVDIVQQDERESGKRAFLNFGHTFGHALEKVAGYGSVSHGDAVFVGMLAAAHYSNALGAPIEKARFSPFKPLYRVALPPKEAISSLISEMYRDKKVKDETIRLILLNEWGSPYIYECRDESGLHAAWNAAFDEIDR